ncbi:MAG: hypothetical protein ACOYXC_20935 [Candidatus Rifleibacteriota bacterium]
MKKIIAALTAISLSFAVAAGAEVSLKFGKADDQVAYINQNSNPGIEEPLPLGPLAFRAVGGLFYIADSVGGKILIADQQKGFVSAVKLTEKPADFLFDDLAVISGKDGKAEAFYLIDALSNSIIRFAADGKEQKRISSDRLVQPYRIEISSQGVIYVADKGARTIFAFDPEGNLKSEVPWEWSGMALSPDAELLYRVFFAPESASSFLVSSNVEGKLTMERELNLGEHFNAELWWVDEEKQECVISYATSQTYEADLIVARVGFDGEVKGKKQFKAPFAMNRFFDLSGTDAWLGVADYSKAPEGTFSIQKFELP